MNLNDMTPEDRARIDRTFAAMKARGVEASFVSDRTHALSALLSMIPHGSKVAHGSSTTLIEIGFVDALKKADSGFEYLNLEWIREADPAKRTRLRARLTAQADYFLGSVQAVCETGEAVSADAGGSRQVGYVFGPPHVIWVAGMNKLVPNVDAGIRRLREVALPQEDARIKSTGGSGSYVGKLVIYERQPPGRTRLVLVGEDLGF